METQYTAYTKSINGRMFYFVKSFQVFPEYSSLGPVLNTFGMHTDFEKACRIAGIPDSKTRRQLFNQIESEVSGRVVKVLVDNATPVEYDQPLFLVEPA